MFNLREIFPVVSNGQLPGNYPTFACCGPSLAKPPMPTFRKRTRHNMRVCSVVPKRLATCTLSAPVAHSSMRRARKTIRFSRCQLSAYVLIPAAGACTAATQFFEESIYFFRRTSTSAAVRSELKPSGGINETAAQDRERKRLCGPEEGVAAGFFMTLGSRSSS
jgi:hypothetical protein